MDAHIRKLVMVSHRRCEIICEQERTISKLKAQIDKMRWHIVADDDLPKDRRNVYIVYLNGEYMSGKVRGQNERADLFY